MQTLVAGVIAPTVAHYTPAAAIDTTRLSAGYRTQPTVARRGSLGWAVPAPNFQIADTTGDTCHPDAHRDRSLFIVHPHLPSAFGQSGANVDQANAAAGAVHDVVELDEEGDCVVGGQQVAVLLLVPLVLPRPRLKH